MGSLRRAVNNTIALGSSVSDFDQECSFSTDFRKKTPGIKFDENLSNESGVDMCRRTDMTELITPYKNAPNAEHELIRLVCLPDQKQIPTYRIHN